MSITVRTIGNVTITTEIRGNTIKTRREFKNPDGTSAGSITTTQSYKKSKKKRPPYNFKQLSSQLIKTKTSSAANRIAAKAQMTVAVLARNLESGDYDEEELEMAIAHAKRIQQVARKKVKHLKAEETMERKKKADDLYLPDPAEQEEEKDSSLTASLDEEELRQLSEEELKQLLKEMEELSKEMESELDELDELNNITEQLTGNASSGPVTKEELQRIKKKHRGDEMREITEADMKYLKALFNKLSREKESGASSFHSSDSDSSNSLSGVSLELSGMEVPVSDAPAAATEGASVDVTI